jgi:NADPH-dependent 2,4-dienoyl-CoA reductase/sulfur reductase-like enzyme
MAEAMKLRGLEVHVVDMAPQPMATMDEELGEQDRRRDARDGHHLHLGSAVEGIETGDDGWVRAVATADGHHRRRPRRARHRHPSLQRPRPRRGHPDRPEPRHRHRPSAAHPGRRGVGGRRLRRDLPPGVAAAGLVRAGHDREQAGPDRGPQPRRQLRRLPGGARHRRDEGLRPRDRPDRARRAAAQEAGFAVVTASIDATTRAHYYPDAKPITIKVIAERGTGKLLGAQIVGEEGAAKRIDVFATALWNEMTVDDLLNVDLSYAPPFSPVWDPVLIAARKADGAVADAAEG